MVSTSACHAAGRGSLPGPGTLLGVKTWLSTFEISVYRMIHTKPLVPSIRGSKRSHQSALEMCNLSWTPHSSLEKDNSLNHSCVSPKDGLFGVYLTKSTPKIALPWDESGIVIFTLSVGVGSHLWDITCNQRTQSQFGSSCLPGMPRPCSIWLIASINQADLTTAIRYLPSETEAPVDIRLAEIPQFCKLRAMTAPDIESMD